MTRRGASQALKPSRRPPRAALQLSRLQQSQPLNPTGCFFRAPSTYYHRVGCRTKTRARAAGASHAHRRYPFLCWESEKPARGFQTPQPHPLRRPAAVRFSEPQRLEPLRPPTYHPVAPPIYYHRVVPVAEPEPKITPLGIDSSLAPRQAGESEKSARDFQPQPVAPEG